MLNIRALLPHEIGGGTVRQRFNAGGRDRMSGEYIDGDELRTWKPSNLRALMEMGKLACVPKTVTVLHQRPNADTKVSDPADDGDISRIVISKGFQRFDVVEGRVLARGVTKQEAHQLAGIPYVAPPPPPAVERPSERMKRKATIRHGEVTAAGMAAVKNTLPRMPDGVRPKAEDDNGPLDV